MIHTPDACIPINHISCEKKITLESAADYFVASSTNETNRLNSVSSPASSRTEASPQGPPKRAQSGMTWHNPQNLYFSVPGKRPGKTHSSAQSSVKYQHIIYACSSYAKSSSKTEEIFRMKLPVNSHKKIFLAEQKSLP